MQDHLRVLGIVLPPESCALPHACEPGPGLELAGSSSPVDGENAPWGDDSFRQPPTPTRYVARGGTGTRPRAHSPPSHSLLGSPPAGGQQTGVEKSTKNADDTKVTWKAERRKARIAT